MQNSRPPTLDHGKIIRASLLGSTTAQKLCQIAFGSFKGLDITDPVDFKIKIRSFFDAKDIPFSQKCELFSNLAIVFKDDTDTIYANPIALAKCITTENRKKFGYGILHETTHLFQKLREHQELSRDVEGSNIDAVTMLWDDLMDQENLVEKERTSLRYLAEMREIQARLFTILASSYSQFEEFPTNYSELIVCLKSQGVHVPNELFEAISQTEEGKRAQEKFNNADNDSKRIDDKAVYDINVVLSWLDSEKETLFWNASLPHLYFDILEMLGDNQGHKRFGHTHNIRFREVFYKSLENANTLANDPQFKQDWQNNNPKIVEMIEGKVAENFARAADILQKMDKDDAIDLGCLVLTGFRYKELGESKLRPPKRDNGNITNFTKAAILMRDDITERDRAILEQAENLYLPENNEQTRATMRDANGALHPSLTFELDAA